jgi:two-component sensor histidine kinase
MAMHELFTNAIKYGALSVESGRVALEWSVTDGAARRLRLEWRETGAPGPEPGRAPPEREGFGTRLIRQVFCHDLGGEVRMDFAPTGLVCVADLPLS